MIPKVERDGDRGQRSEVGGQRIEVLNIEPQNNKPQNDEVITSTFEIPCSTFCGSERRELRCSQFWLLFSWILTPDSLLLKFKI